jgi:hypothetical protein
MKSKTILVESHSSMRGEKKSIAFHIDDAVNKFFGENPGIVLRGYSVDADTTPGGRQSAVISIAYDGGAQAQAQGARLK